MEEEIIYPNEIKNTVPLLKEIDQGLNAFFWDIYLTKITGQEVVANNVGYLYDVPELLDMLTKTRHLVTVITSILRTHNHQEYNKMVEKTTVARRGLHEFKAKQTQLYWQTKKANKVHTTTVYLMHNKRNGLYKIGRSIKPSLREKTLQSQEPEIEITATYPATNKDEKILHQTFYDKHVRGEWFNLESSDLALIEYYFQNKNDR